MNVAVVILLMQVLPLLQTCSDIANASIAAITCSDIADVSHKKRKRLD